MTEWIVTSSVLIVVVVLLRQILKGKLSLRLQYGLWALVLIRLLIPGSFVNSSISVMNAVREVQTEQVEITVDIPPSRLEYPGIELVPAVGDPSLPEEERNEQQEQLQQEYEDELDAAWEQYKAENTREVTFSVPDILRMIWIVGMAAMALCLLISNLRFWGRLRRSRQVLHYSPLTIYVTGAVETPCLFGLFRPAIYVTPEVAEDEVAMGHVLAHEHTHYRHRDHLWAVLRCVCLALHWYNPLVWVAAALSRRDGELACDEGAIRRIGEGERAAYGRTLIGLTCTGRGGLLRTATTMTGSKKSIRERIVLIAKKPKMKTYTLIAVLLLAAIAVGCTYTGRPDTPAEGFVEWVDDLTVEDLDDVTTNLGDQYYLTEEQSGALLAALQTVEKGSLMADDEGALTDDNHIIVHLGDEKPVTQWKFVCLMDGTVRVTCVGDEMIEQYGVDQPIRVNSPELYAFIVESVGKCREAEDIDAPHDVKVYAHEVLTRHLAQVETRSVNPEWRFGYELRGLTFMNTGTAGAPGTFELSMYQMDYTIRVFNETEESLTDYICYLLFFTEGTINTPVGVTDLATILSVYGTEDMLAQYGGNMFTAAAMEMYEVYQAEGEQAIEFPPVVESSQPGSSASPAAPEEMMELLDLLEELDITLHTAEQGQRNTYSMDHYDIKFGRSILGDYYHWTKLSAEPEVDSQYWLTIGNGEASLTLFHGDEGLARYEDGAVTLWWTAEKISDSALLPAAELRRSLYDGKELNMVGLTVAAHSPEQAAEKFVFETYRDHRMNVSPGNIQEITDYTVVNWKINEIGVDGDAVVVSFSYAFLPARDMSYFIVGNFREGTGQYAGWGILGWEVLLELREDGLWHCAVNGTGGITLSYYGYEALQYSSPMENDTVYRCQSTSPEDAALTLAKAYMDDMMGYSGLRTFTILEYRNLTVWLTPTLEENAAAVYLLQQEEIGDNTWVVDIGVEYRCAGTITNPPVGPVPEDAVWWIESLAQGSPVGFLLTYDGTEYTLQSRYDKVY